MNNDDFLSILDPIVDSLENQMKEARRIREDYQSLEHCDYNEKNRADYRYHLFQSRFSDVKNLVNLELPTYEIIQAIYGA